MWFRRGFASRAGRSSYVTVKAAEKARGLCTGVRDTTLCSIFARQRQYESSTRSVRETLCRAARGGGNGRELRLVLPHAHVWFLCGGGEVLEATQRIGRPFAIARGGTGWRGIHDVDGDFALRLRLTAGKT